MKIGVPKEIKPADALTNETIAYVLAMAEKAWKYTIGFKLL